MRQIREAEVSTHGTRAAKERTKHWWQFWR